MAKAKKEEEMVVVPIKEKSAIAPLSVDFPSEQLNDMARKINEIINAIN